MFRSRAAALDWEPREGMAGGGARAGDAVRAARALPAHRRGDAARRHRPALRALPAAEGEARAPKGCSMPREAPAAAFSALHRRGDLAQRCGAARCAHDPRAPQRRPSGDRLSRRRCRASGAAAQSPPRWRGRTPGRNATCCCWCAAAARSRTSGNSTRKRWRARCAPRAFRWWWASAMRPISRSPTSLPTSAPPRRPRRPSSPARRAPSCSSSSPSARARLSREMRRRIGYAAQAAGRLRAAAGAPRAEACRPARAHRPARARGSPSA